MTIFRNKDIWSLADDLAIDLALIPNNRKRRGLVNRTLWETLRSSIFQGVMKKTGGGGGQSLFSAVVAAARAQNNNTNHEAESRAGRIVYGRLKKAPKLPSKPALQSSESSTDDLSGSEDSSSDDIDGDAEQNNAKETPSKVSILSGHGTEDDDNDTSDPNDQKSNQKSSKTADLCIEIKLGKVKCQVGN